MLVIVDNTLMWLLVPQILHGFGYMLVFLTVLEFICAQTPFRLKGFMVGIWYAMLSVKFFITTIDIVIAYCFSFSFLLPEHNTIFPAKLLSLAFKISLRLFIDELILFIICHSYLILLLQLLLLSIIRHMQCTIQQVWFTVFFSSII